MFHHHAQARRRLADRVQNAVDEHGLAVKDVDLGVGDFTMNTHAAGRSRPFSPVRGAPCQSSRTPECRIGRGPRRVQLDRFNQPAGMGGRQIVLRICILGQVQGHQWLERHAVGQRSHDTVTVSGGLIAA